jgi:hypothetical protein
MAVPSGNLVWRCPGGGVASSVSDRDVSTLIERQHLVAVLGQGLPREDHDLGG